MKNGHYLYNRWQHFMVHRGVGTDTWEDLDEIDQGAWNDLADELDLPEELGE